MNDQDVCLTAFLTGVSGCACDDGYVLNRFELFGAEGGDITDAPGVSQWNEVAAKSTCVSV